MLESSFIPAAGQAFDTFQEKYARTPGETWAELSVRTGTAVGAAEENGKAKYYGDLFAHQINDGLFMPGGRVLRGAGRKVQQLLNCFVVPTKDSIEGWGKTVADVMAISARGGGVGANFSPIRPRGSYISGMGGEATGAVSLMEMVNGIGDVLMGGGGRRMALMFDLDIDHPDIVEFLEAKFIDPKASEQERRAQGNRLKNANVSVVLPQHISSERFQEMVRHDEQIELTFKGLPDERGRTVSAKWLWERIVHNAWNSGEPGVLNSHLANKMNNIGYHKDLISTNPCGEIWLEEYGCCCLGALVLSRFVQDGKFDWEAFGESIHLAVRFLDDVLDVNHYPLPEIEENCREVRRIGLGLMGLHSALLDMGLKYSSDEGFQFVEDVFKFMRNSAYRASINLAIEKGPFAAFRPEFCDSEFIKELPEDLQRDIRRHGIRNCALLTLAPTGTTSMVQGVSGGVEPTYSGVYKRTRKRDAGGGRTEDVTVLVVSKEWTDHMELFEGALDIHPEIHMRMQALVQRYIDNAVSKTINLPKDFPVSELAELWLKYLPFMKGSTFYRSGSRFAEPMEHVPAEELSTLILDWDGPKEYEDAQSMECIGGACDVVLPGGLGEESDRATV